MDKEKVVYVVGQFATGKSHVTSLITEKLRKEGGECVASSDYSILLNLVAKDQTEERLHSKVDADGFVLLDNTLMAQTRDLIIGTEPEAQFDIREVAVGGDTEGIVVHSFDDFLDRLGASPALDRNIVVFVDTSPENRFRRNRERLERGESGVPQEAMDRFATGREGGWRLEHETLLSELDAEWYYYQNDGNLDGLVEFAGMIVDQLLNI